jgi:hypothetical protein
LKLEAYAKKKKGEKEGDVPRLIQYYVTLLSSRANKHS